MATLSAVTNDTTPSNYRLENLLLVMSGAFVIVNALALGLQGIGGSLPIVHVMAWIVAAIGGAWFLRRHVPQHDPFLFPLVMFFSGWGVLLIDRLAPIFAERQTVWLLLGVFALCVTASFPQLLRWLRQYRYLLLLLGLALLVSTILLGRNPSGLIGAPELWLGIGNVFFQPSEALKIILVAFLASYLGENAVSLRLTGRGWQQAWLSPRLIGPILLMWSLCVLVLVWQRDLGTAALFFAVFLILLYVASGQLWILATGIVLIGAAGVVAYFAFSVVQLRVDIWLNPWLEADGRAYQVVQSLMAVANGGIFGQGIGQGAPTYIPVVHSDFVFSALAEEWGLLGVIVLLGGFAILLLRGMRVATLHQSRPF